MEKSYLAMDDGEKAAAEAENAMMLARVNFMVAYGKCVGAGFSTTKIGTK